MYTILSRRQFWLYLDAEVLVLPPVFYPQDLFCWPPTFRRQPTPVHPFPVSSVVLVWPVRARGFCHSPRRFLACWEYPSPLYCLMLYKKGKLGPARRGLTLTLCAPTVDRQPLHRSCVCSFLLGVVFFCMCVTSG